jgi:hypothetical protein
MRKFGQANGLTGKVAGTKELGSAVDKEQSGARPDGADFRNNAGEEGSQRKSEGSKNFGNQKLPKWEEEEFTTHTERKYGSRAKLTCCLSEIQWPLGFAG